MEGIPPHKRAGTNRCIRHLTPLSAAARAGYECAQVPAYRRHARRRSSQGRSYGSNRSREGPHPSSSGRWPAERGRRRAGAARLARSKGPPAPRDDDGRGQKGNFARPRSRPHVLISAEPRAIDRGIPLRTVTAPRGTAAAERKTPPTAGLKFWDERTQRVVEFVPPTAMRNLAGGSALSIKTFRRQP